MKVAVTGSDGFLGWHLRVRASALRPDLEVISVTRVVARSNLASCPARPKVAACSASKLSRADSSRATSPIRRARCPTDPSRFSKVSCSRPGMKSSTLPACRSWFQKNNASSYRARSTDSFPRATSAWSQEPFAMVTKPGSSRWSVSRTRR